jgi:peptidoglycan/xylan/chitin deacetylase (PgdA/CDA1 family)
MKHLCTLFSKHNHFFIASAFLSIILLAFSASAFSAVILQYHHVSSTTPKSTSITPAQFELHLKYLKDNNFKVVPLSVLVDSIQKQTPMEDKTVAITFDDAYIDVLTQAKPLLDKYNYPYTMFANANIIDKNEGKKNSQYLSWEQLKAMGDDGMIIANHGFEHDSMIRVPNGLTKKEWLDKRAEQLLKSEQIIKDKTGQNWRYFAYPYGEYDVDVQAWIKENNFIAFSQQSGAIGLTTDLSIIPRFPASMPYDKIPSLRDKLNSLAFDITLEGKNAQTVFEHKQAQSITFSVATDDFYKSQLNCYISGLGKQKIKWLDDNNFSIDFSKPLPSGRVRCNCTAASISKSGRYYWYSKPWFVLKPGGAWYHL